LPQWRSAHSPRAQTGPMLRLSPEDANQRKIWNEFWVMKLAGELGASRSQLEDCTRLRISRDFVLLNVRLHNDTTAQFLLVAEKFVMLNDGCDADFSCSRLVHAYDASFAANANAFREGDLRRECQREIKLGAFRNWRVQVKQHTASAYIF